MICRHTPVIIATDECSRTSAERPSTRAAAESKDATHGGGWDGIARTNGDARVIGSAGNSRGASDRRFVLVLRQPSSPSVIFPRKKCSRLGIGLPTADRSA